MIYLYLVTLLFGNANKPPYYISYECVKRASVYTEPSYKSPLYGVVEKGTRFPVIKHLKNKKCHRGYFIKVAHNQYVCTKRLIPSLSFPGGKQIPELKGNNILPTTLKWIKINNTPLFTNRINALEKKPAFLLPRGAIVAYRNRYTIVKTNIYNYTSEDFLIKRDSTKTLQNFSKFHGKTKFSTKYIPAIVVSKRGAFVYKLNPFSRVKVLKRYTWINLIPKKIRSFNNSRYFQLDNGLWISEITIKRFFFSKKPRILTKPHEKWIEVVISQQTMVTYKGDIPQFITLVSTAKKGYETPVGVFRIFHKRGIQNLGRKNGKKWRYKLEAVPWLQFFKGVMAIHTSYWHDDFGQINSKGCVEVSPIDAKILYEWTSPHVLKGFLTAAQNKYNIGTVIRIINKPFEKVNYRSRSFPKSTKN
jgi:L,D-transpeptidase catalytic domain